MPIPDYQACQTCESKPGSPILCESCLHNRALVGALKEMLKEKALKKALYHLGVFSAAKSSRPEDRHEWSWSDLGKDLAYQLEDQLETEWVRVTNPSR